MIEITIGNTIEYYLKQMNDKITKRKYFGLDTDYLFISLPLIDKAKIIDVIMKKVVKKYNEYKQK